MSIDDFIRKADLKDNELMRRILMNFDQGDKCSISTEDFLSAMERMHQMHSAEQRIRREPFLPMLVADTLGRCKTSKGSLEPSW